MNSTYNLEKISHITSEAWTYITEHSSKDHATVVCLYGDLGAGKTTFVKHLSEFLEIQKTIQSPTFVILKNYELPQTSHRGSFSHLIHIDAYRLADEKELEKLGWDTYLKDSQNIIFIEWPSIVPGLIPTEHINITLTHIDENHRAIEII